MDSTNSNTLLILVGMFADYQKSVIAFYEARKADRTLSLLLINLTPANLKKECKVVCEGRYDRRDARILRAFFEQGGDEKTFLHEIKHCNRDKFRPLINFLAGRTGDTSEINIELLAWLIDFKPRPYDDRYNYENLETRNDLKEAPHGNDEEVIKDNASKDNRDSEKDELEPGPVEPEKQSFIFGLWEGVVVITLLVLIIIGIRFCTGPAQKPSALVLTGQACMFWNGDHYEPTSCSQKPGNTLVVALDSGKLDHFRMVPCPGTNTDEWKGKLWYVKYNGKLELYTDSGFHPIDQRLRLKPITRYILNKYCH